MDQDSLCVRNVVQQAISDLSSISDGDRMAEVLRGVRHFLGGGAKQAPAHEREEFNRTHYTPFLRLLVSHMGPQWLELLSSEGLELWESFFLEGPADQALLVLMDCIARSGPSVRLDRSVLVLERFLQQGALCQVIWGVCQQQLQTTPTPVLQEAILGRLCSLPDHLANCLKDHNKPLFYPKNYYPLLGASILRVLQMVSESLRDGKGCSISFVSQVLGKVCMQGRREELFAVLVPRLTALVQSDCIWQRICWRLVESVPDRWMEPVVVGLVQMVPGPAALSQILGDLVIKNKKTQFVLTRKLLFLQHGLKVEGQQSILGYLSLDPSRRHLLVKVLRELLEVWSSGSAVRHSHHPQLLHMCRAVLICLGLLTRQEMETCRQDLLTALTAGTRCYLDSSLPTVRRLGMVVAECLSRHVGPEAPVLTFQYEEDEESRELKSLLTPPCLSVADPLEREKMPAASPSSQDAEDTASKPAPGPEGEPGSDSELDSDDDLLPYDMSTDTEMRKGKPPAYIRDSMDVLVSSEDMDRVEVTMESLGTLIRANTAATKEVSVELAKILLHLDKPGVERFTELRHGALVSVTAIDPVPVSQYLTGEFYSINYNLRQRLDMLDVLASVAQELSQPVTTVRPVTPGSLSRDLRAVGVTSGSERADAPSDWRKMVEERIERKTRRFAKGPATPVPVSFPNRFHAVAGHFFFPLIQNFDRPMVTCDLLGEDRLVLGRLVHTLGILMHLALHAMVVSQMGKALLEFVWALRFHTDPFVRQGLLFCVCTTLLSVPWERLMSDMAEEVLETQCWLADVAEKDPDDDCRRLALNGLLVMERLRNDLRDTSCD
ncbi:telomere length regulation protein TEL2 homolog isoform X2 [Ascaphus truei]